MLAKTRDELVCHVLAQQVQVCTHTEVGQQRAHELMISLGLLDLARMLGFEQWKDELLLGFEMSEDSALEIGPVTLDGRLIGTFHGVLEVAEELLEPPMVSSQ
jgi:hypothetical protein